MKKILGITILGFILLTFQFCKKNEITYGDFSIVTPEQGLLKINYASSYTANPGIHLEVNNKRVSNIITGRTPFPGGGYNTLGDSRPDYLAVSPGNTSITVAVPNKGTNTDSVVLFTGTTTIEAGKNYTAHITDTANKTKLFVTVDEFSLPDSGFAKFKFVNLMPNVTALDLYYGATKVASNIQYLAASDYFTIAVPSTALAWTIRETGTMPTSTALATYSSASTTSNQRVYTAFALGYKGLTDAVRKSYIAFLLNR